MWISMFFALEGLAVDGGNGAPIGRQDVDALVEFVRERSLEARREAGRTVKDSGPVFYDGVRRVTNAFDLVLGHFAGQLAFELQHGNGHRAEAFWEPLRQAAMEWADHPSFRDEWRMNS
ncbi:hypothetical protein [Streptomyces sp. NPDC057675]|uniref:hypothetical protein n=1 Tax=Streptomyces sp. NPDC057675 TaxID=3346204 RepID=UPI00369982BE